MVLRRAYPRNRRYKFYKVDLWGRLFMLRPFREREVLFARLNKRLTTRKVKVNPVKLRTGKSTVVSQGIYAKQLVKRFYYNIKEPQLRLLVSRAVKLAKKPHRICRDRLADTFMRVIESRLDGLMWRSGLFRSPSELRQHFNHRRIAVDNCLKKSPHNLVPQLSFLSVVPSLRRDFYRRYLQSLILGNKHLFCSKKRKRRSAFNSWSLVSLKTAYLNFSLKQCFMLTDFPKRVSQVYFPFELDVKKFLLHYKYIRS